LSRLSAGRPAQNTCSHVNQMFLFSSRWYNCFFDWLSGEGTLNGWLVHLYEIRIFRVKCFAAVGVKSIV
jgi:hypothetical protein